MIREDGDMDVTNGCELVCVLTLNIAAFCAAAALAGTGLERAVRRVTRLKHRLNALFVAYGLVFLVGLTTTAGLAVV